MSKRAILLVALTAIVIVVAGGVAWAATPMQCEAGVTCLGTSGDDVITGTSSADTIKARAGRDEAFGLGRGDMILGQDGVDFLYGGAGNDTLNEGPNPDTEFSASCGGTGDDTLVESAGQDFHRFQPNWGHDVISGEVDDGLLDLLRFDGGPCGTSTTAVSADLTVRFATGRAFETSAGSFKLSANTVQWTPAVMEGVYTGSGNDTITGDGGYNNVHGEDGNDIIDVSGDPLQSDFVDCGNGTDTVTRDPNDTVFGTTCETVLPE